MLPAYYELIEKFKTNNLNFDFGYESLIIDSEERNHGVFIRYTPLHKEEFCSYVYDEKRVFAFTDLPMEKDKFITNYIEFMDTYTSKKRNTRYGVSIIIAFPKLLKDMKKRKKFVMSYVKGICGIDIDVPYFVEIITRGSCEYAKITIIERTFIGKQEWKIYKKDGVIDVRTGRWASRNCPQEYKKHLFKAGDYVVDKKGNKIPGGAIFSNSLRIFLSLRIKQQKETYGKNF